MEQIFVFLILEVTLARIQYQILRREKSALSHREIVTLTNRFFVGLNAISFGIRLGEVQELYN